MTDDYVRVKRADLELVASAATAFVTAMYAARRAGHNPLAGARVTIDGIEQPLPTPDWEEASRAVIAVRRVLGWRK